MHAIALPGLTAALRRPVVALVEPFVALPTDQPAVPAGVVVIEIICPAADVLLTMPARTDFTSDGAAHAAQAWDDWVDRFLARAIHSPRLEAHEVPDALGLDREHLAMSLLRCWSFAPEVDGEFPRLPSPAVRDMLAFLAVRLRRAPSDLVREPLAALIFDWRVLLGSRAHAAALIGDDDGD